jgi:hypothetical protein
MAKKWTLARAFPLMLGGAILVGIVAVGVGSHLRRANAIAASAASVDSAALAGEPCPTLTKADYEARGAKAKQAFVTNDIRYERRFGHADCNVVAAGDGFAPVCQFSGPALLVVTTEKGAFYFAPGAGRRVTVITREGVPSCVLPKVSDSQAS